MTHQFLAKAGVPMKTHFGFCSTGMFADEPSGCL